MADDYYERQEARRERYECRADKAKKDSTAYYEQSSKEAQRVPLGQPILIGHHSEGKMRAHYNRVGRLMDKSCAERDKAAHYRQKAASVGDCGISSDAPDAIELLTEKIDKAIRSITW